MNYQYWKRLILIDWKFIYFLPAEMKVIQWSNKDRLGLNYEFKYKSINFKVQDIFNFVNKWSMLRNIYDFDQHSLRKRALESANLKAKTLLVDPAYDLKDNIEDINPQHDEEDICQVFYPEGDTIVWIRVDHG